jgi:hypothetical protein
LILCLRKRTVEINLKRRQNSGGEVSPSSRSPCSRRRSVCRSIHSMRLGHAVDRQHWRYAYHCLHFHNESGV